MLEKLKKKLNRMSHKRRRILSAAGMAMAVVMIFAAVSAPEYISAYSTKKQLPIYSVERDQKMISLSFDAAWGDVRLR